MDVSTFSLQAIIPLLRGTSLTGFHQFDGSRQQNMASCRTLRCPTRSWLLPWIFRTSSPRTGRKCCIWQFLFRSGMVGVTGQHTTFLHLSHNAEFNCAVTDLNPQWQEKSVNTGHRHDFSHETYVLCEFFWWFCRVHPRDKETVGFRLASSGLSQAYNLTVKHQGPVPTAVKQSNGRMQITYDSGHTVLSIRSIQGYDVSTCI